MTAFDTLIHKTPVWCWTVWLPTIIIHFSRASNDEVVNALKKAIRISSHIYPEYVQYVLTTMMNREMSKVETEILETSLENL